MTGTAAANARQPGAWLLPPHSPFLPPHSLPPRTAITLRGAARATAVRATAVVTAADATAGVRRRFQGARVRSSKNRGGLKISDRPDFFLRVRDYSVTGVLRWWRRKVNPALIPSFAL